MTDTAATPERETTPPDEITELASRSPLEPASEARVYELFFNVTTNLRYHEKRRAFYEGIDRGYQILSLVVASASVTAAISKAALGVQVGLSVTLAVINAVVLVMKPGPSATKHIELRGRYLDIAKRLAATGERVYAREVAAWGAEVREIERDEPPVRVYVQAECWNEFKMRENHAFNMLRLWPWQRLLKHVVTGDATKVRTKLWVPPDWGSASNQTQSKLGTTPEEHHAR